MQNIFEYDVFLSFASSDQDAVKPIWQELSHSGLRVFWSDENLKQNIGQSFFSVIQDALSNSNHFLLICSLNSMHSNWVREEYETFFNQAYIPSGRKRRLLLYILHDCPKSILPPLLKNIQISKTVEDIVSILGGVNIQLLKKENAELKNIISKQNAKLLNIGNENIKLEKTNHELKSKIDELKIELSNAHISISMNSEIGSSKKLLIPEGSSFETNDAGFLQSFHSWNNSWINYVMKEEGLKNISDDHYKVMHVIREYYEINGIAPLVRDLCKKTGFKLKHIYELFPSGPGKGACRMAGLPSPAGCV